jgi:hypothetical protein
MRDTSRTITRLGDEVTVYAKTVIGENEFGQDTEEWSEKNTALCHRRYSGGDTGLQFSFLANTDILEDERFGYRGRFYHIHSVEHRPTHTIAYCSEAETWTP